VEGFALEASGDPEKLDEFINVMSSYGEIQVTRSGLIAVSLEMKKLRLAPPVPKGSEPINVEDPSGQNAAVSQSR
jgi:acetolactate synthase I/III small subunit